MARIIQEVVDAVAEEFMIHKRDLLGRYRFQFLLPGRFALYKILWLRGNSYADIGRWMDRDHTSIIHGCRRADYMLDKHQWYRTKVDNVMIKIGMKGDSQ